MPTFRYRGKRKTGEVAIGAVKARNQDEAIELVSQQGILPIAMEEDRFANRSTRFKVSTRISFHDV